MVSLTIGFTHRPPPRGGPGSFQSRLIRCLETAGHNVVYPEDKTHPDIILVIGGTSKLFWLLKSKFYGTKIVHRLDGINWRHTIDDVSTSYKIKCEIRNLIVLTIKSFFADHVVYQSKFVKNWWERKYGREKRPFDIIHNGVDVDQFTPSAKKTDRYNLKIICAEGNLHADKITKYLINSLKENYTNHKHIKKILIAGNIEPQDSELLNYQNTVVQFIGSIPRCEMHTIYKDADIFFSLEINAACPNSVIEALASGLPIVGMNTGAMPELVTDKAGVIADYEADPWKREQPQFSHIQKAIDTVIGDINNYKCRARAKAIKDYNINTVMEKYIAIMQRLPSD